MRNKRQGMQDLVEKFQSLINLNQIDSLKQSLILNFFVKETYYFLMLKLIHYLVPYATTSLCTTLLHLLYIKYVWKICLKWCISKKMQILNIIFSPLP